MSTKKKAAKKSGKDVEIARLKAELDASLAAVRVESDAFAELDEKMMRIEDALSEAESLCHKTDAKGIEVISIIRRALGGGGDE